jgi:hypothetical protein
MGVSKQGMGQAAKAATQKVGGLGSLRAVDFATPTLELRTKLKMGQLGKIDRRQIEP